MLGYKVNWEEDTVSVTCLRKLTHAPLKGELQCTRLAWNSTGSSLAVAYGRMDHQDWCKHKVSCSLATMGGGAIKISLFNGQGLYASFLKGQRQKSQIVVKFKNKRVPVQTTCENYRYKGSSSALSVVKGRSLHISS